MVEDGRRMIQYIKFGQNPSFSSNDSKWKHKFGQNLKFRSAGVTLKIRSRSSKSNQLFTPSQPCIYVSLVKICSLVQKLECGKG